MMLSGVPHAAELPYVFGWANMKLAPQVRVDARIPIDVMNYNEEDFLYTDFTMDLWTNFAKFGYLEYLYKIDIWSVLSGRM